MIIQKILTKFIVRDVFKSSIYVLIIDSLLRINDSNYKKKRISRPGMRLKRINSPTTPKNFSIKVNDRLGAFKNF